MFKILIGFIIGFIVGSICFGYCTYIYEIIKNNLSLNTLTYKDYLIKVRDVLIEASEKNK